MPIEVSCSVCGKGYKLKDEYAGRRVKCPACQNVIDVPRAAPPPPAYEVAEEDPPPFSFPPAPGGRPARAEGSPFSFDRAAPARTRRPAGEDEYRDGDGDAGRPARDDVDPAFDRDKFLLRQKVWSIKQVYTVADEDNDPVLFVQRPVHLVAGCLAMAVGFAVMFVLGALAVFVAAALKGEAAVVVGSVLGVGVVLIGLTVIVALYPKRHIEFYADKKMTEPLMKVLQDKKVILINMTYTLTDNGGEVLARFRKNYLYNILRKRWYVHRPDGSLWFVAKEDSIIMSLLRRTVGAVAGEIPLLGLVLAAAMRTNFVFLRAGDDEHLGTFNRRLTLLDRYVLDLTDDPDREIDRRVAVAMGVLLDTGERR